MRGVQESGCASVAGTHGRDADIACIVIEAGGHSHVLRYDPQHAAEAFRMAARMIAALTWEMGSDAEVRVEVEQCTGK